MPRLPVVVAVESDTALGGFPLEDALRRREVDWLAVATEEAQSTLTELAAGGQVAVVGAGPAGEVALELVAETGGIEAVAIIGTPLSAEAVQLVADWPELALLAIADPADREGLQGVVDAYLASGHEGSALLVGAVDGATAERAADWLADRLHRTTSVDEVTLTSSDDWELHGTRWLPRRDHPVPGIVLLHSGRSDRAVFARLERLLAERGFAVLNLDWRGRGRSINRGTYMELGADERAAGWRDAAAAFDHLAALPGVDAQRLGAVGVIHGAEHAVRAAADDGRVRAIVVLTGYRPVEPAETAYLTDPGVDVLYVTSTAHRATSAAMRTLYDASSSRHTRFVEYAGGAIGYQLFELDPGLEPAIVDWFAEVLPP
jgi:dienelactone hydrolase